MTPRDVIRNEEPGRPSVIPRDHVHDLFEDDSPLCEMLRDEALSGESGEWYFGLAADFTLLDEDDPEGYEAHGADDDVADGECY